MKGADEKIKFMSNESVCFIIPLYFANSYLLFSEQKNHQFPANTRINLKIECLNLRWELNNPKRGNNQEKSFKEKQRVWERQSIWKMWK